MMKKISYWFQWACLAGAISGGAVYGQQQSAGVSLPDRTLVLVLLDGVRWDALNDRVTPNLLRLAHQGVRAEMIPVWPTLSYPNHWSISTGLYPTSGGPHSSTIYNPATSKTLTIDEMWAHAEPIWATVARQGGISGVVGWWMGAQVSQGTNRPTYFVPYYPKAGDVDQQANVILGLLDQDPESRPRLLATYSPDVDGAQHTHGVASPEANAALHRLDQMIGDLMEGIAKRGLSDKVTLVVVSDHGQIEIGPNERRYYLDDFVDLASLATPPLDGGAMMQVWPKPGMEQQVLQHLADLPQGLHLYRPQDLPARWHCCNPAYETPIILTTDPGVSILVHGQTIAQEKVKATHGYDTTVRSMHGLFVAAGAGIRPEARLEPFENVDIYPLAADLLGLTPAHNDGSIRPLCPALLKPPRECTNESVSRVP